MKKVVNKKVNYLRLFFTIFLSVFLIYFIYFAGTLFYLKMVDQNFNSSYENTVSPGEYFSDCIIKYENCLNSDCNLYIFCNDKEYQSCKIYDCEKSYGIATKIEGEDFVFKNELKPDYKKNVERKNACEGNIEVLEDSCIDGEGLIKIKLSIEDKEACPINRFIVDVKDVGDSSNNFILDSDNIYNINFEHCGDLNKIIAIGSGGIVIDTINFN